MPSKAELLARFSNLLARESVVGGVTLDGLIRWAGNGSTMFFYYDMITNGPHLVEKRMNAVDINIEMTPEEYRAWEDMVARRTLTA